MDESTKEYTIYPLCFFTCNWNTGLYVIQTFSCAWFATAGNCKTHLRLISWLSFGQPASPAPCLQSCVFSILLDMREACSWRLHSGVIIWLLSHFFHFQRDIMVKNVTYKGWEFLDYRRTDISTANKHGSKNQVKWREH